MYYYIIHPNHANQYMDFIDNDNKNPPDEPKKVIKITQPDIPNDGNDDKNKTQSMEKKLILYHDIDNTN